MTSFVIIYLIYFVWLYYLNTFYYYVDEVINNSNEYLIDNSQVIKYSNDNLIDDSEDAIILYLFLLRKIYCLMSSDLLCSMMIDDYHEIYTYILMSMDGFVSDLRYYSDYFVIIYLYCCCYFDD